MANKMDRLEVKEEANKIIQEHNVTKKKLKCEYPQLIENLKKHYHFMKGEHIDDLINGVMKQRILDLYPDTFTKYEIEMLVELVKEE